MVSIIMPHVNIVKRYEGQQDIQKEGLGQRNIRAECQKQAI
jgi:hypothetical protein